MDAERRAKLVRRTVVGLALAVFAALFVVAVYRSETGLEIVLVTGVASVLGAFELHRMGRPHGWRMAAPLAAGLAVSLTCAALALRSGPPFPVGSGASELAAQLGLAAVAALVAAWLTPTPGTCRPAFRVPLALWAACPLLWALYVWQRYGNGGFVSLLILSKLGDIAGYYVGSLIGRTHPFPRLSPGKTTAGCVGSLVAGTLAGFVLAALEILPVGPGAAGLLAGAAFGGLLNVAAQAGDLLESRVKRASGVKDSGTLFGPSGGALDVVDSFLLTLPAALAIGPLLLA